MLPALILSNVISLLEISEQGRDFHQEEPRLPSQWGKFEMTRLLIADGHHFWDQALQLSTNPSFQ